MSSPRLTLTDNTIQVWCVALDTISAYLDWLSEDEQARARRFVFDLHRRRYIAARHTLRQLLGRYLGIEPGAVQFSYGQYGKPTLANSNPTLQFNLSHSEDLAVYAFARGYNVGIDVEQIHPLPERDEMARSFFSPAEVATLERLPPSERNRGFFDCWTRKEAYIKALGSGLSHPLDSFTVPLTACDDLCNLTDRLEPGSDWSLWSFQPAPGYTAALVVETRQPLTVELITAPF